jgi:hypothetical protein
MTLVDSAHVPTIVLLSEVNALEGYGEVRSNLYNLYYYYNEFLFIP